MQQELKRIKNKDLSTLDQRLFGNLDKVQTINSTLENLGQFQQFLLKQICQFEQKAKTKNKSKQVTQVIEQNCLTLRESILNVIPDDLESSRSRMRQTINSPINGFRSTLTNGFSKNSQHQQESFRVHQSLQTELMKKIEDLELKNKQSLKKQEDFRATIAKMKDQYSCLKERFESLQISLKKQFQVKLKKQVDFLNVQNTKLNEESQQLKNQNSRLSEQLARFQKLPDLQKQKTMGKLFENPLHLQQNNQLLKPFQTSGLKKSIIKQSCQKQSKQHQFMSFKEKMKFDFTSKLNKYQHSQVKTRKELQESQQIQKDGSDTFRDANTIQLGQFSSACEQTRGVYRSVQISRNEDNELQPNVPSLLKRNSISDQQYHSSSNVSLQKTSKQLISLESSSSYNSNNGIRSSYQSRQKPRQDSLTSKKSNHDIMRKTKSNFFKIPIQNKQNNIQSIESFYDSNIAKMKGLASQQNTYEKKRNSQSKQKLKIFSII